MDKKIIYEDQSGIRVSEVFINGKIETELIINGIFIMASYNSPSSIALVKEGIAKLSEDIKKIKILIGGLGMGYSLCEAIKYDSYVEVVEIEKKIVDINRNIFNNSECMDRTNVKIINEDFFEFINKNKDLYNLIVMDIDNGPMQLLHLKNSRVYKDSFFNTIKNRLKNGGIFGVWSCNYDKILFENMEKTFGNCSVKIIEEKIYDRDVEFFIFFSEK